MEGYIKNLKEKGIKVTAQRIAVLSALKESEHLTAEEIFEGVRKKFPTISLATVYAILDTLWQKGLVEVLRIVPEKACFGVKMDVHHHFYCKKCRAVFNVHIPLCPSLRRKEVAGNLIEEVQGNFYGLCKKCRAKHA
jgi:Fur family peroxide stress response transcriptional regulator